MTTYRIPVADYNALEEMFLPFDEAGQEIALRDNLDRYWIFTGDENGYRWGLSFQQEDEEKGYPRYIEDCPITFPAVILASPTH